MKKFLLVLLALAMGFQGSLMAQEKTVTGKVTGGDDGLGIPRVNVTVKGTSRGVPTDIDGNYNIQVNSSDVLVFSFIGYIRQEVTVGTQTVIDVVLQPDVTALEEVVVIGYGQVEAKDATGAIQSIKAEDFNGGVIASPEQLIQGKSAGVQITTASGEPGAGVNIRIRGTSSVRNGNNPLFVVDGIPLSGGDVTPGGANFGSGGSSARNPLNFINPNDIASIDILKDASATAIYGSRGANGVIIITTKSGRGAAASVEYSSSLSIATSAKEFDLLNREEFLESLERFGGDPDALDYGADTDWQDLILRTAASHKHDISYANSYDNGNYRVSLGYNNQQGIIDNSDLERLNARLNLNHSMLNDKLHFGAQITLSRLNDRGVPITNDAGFEGDLLGGAYISNPTIPGYADTQVPGISNPLAFLKYIEDKSETDRSLINLSADYDITPELNFKVNVGLDDATGVRNQAYTAKLNAGQGGVFGNGRAAINTLETSSQLLEAFFNYTKELSNGKLTALAGYSYQKFEYKNSYVQGWGFADPDANAMFSDLQVSADNTRAAITQSYQNFAYDADGLFINTLFPAVETVNLDARPNKLVRSLSEGLSENVDELQSYFFRVNYSMNDKYLITGTLRADGSTKFGSDNKYGYFPSGSFAWRLSEEDFIPDAFSNLKLRLGYGITGNQEIPHNVHQRRQRWDGIGIGDDGNINPPGINNVTNDNPDLQWEQTSQLNVGLDFGVIDGRLTGSVDFYKKNTTDLLMLVSFAQPAAQSFIYRNLDADVINRGVEVNLDYLLIDQADVSWNMNVNVSYNKNRVENYNGADLNTGAIRGQGLTGAFAQRVANNQPLFAYFLREFIGYDQNGLAQYEGGDVQRFLDGKSPLPKYNVGFSTTFKYKSFDLSVFMNGQFGHYIYSNTANGFFTAGAYANGRNVPKSVLTSGESPVNAPEVSTRFLEKGDFLRMQNLSFGYNFDMGTSSFFNSLRLSVIAQNLFVITNYSGLDPEVNTDGSMNGVPSLGIDYTAYPRARTFTLGLNATF